MSVRKLKRPPGSGGREARVPVWARAYVTSTRISGRLLRACIRRPLWHGCRPGTTPAVPAAPAPSAGLGFRLFSRQSDQSAIGSIGNRIPGPPERVRRSGSQTRGSDRPTMTTRPPARRCAGPRGHGTPRTRLPRPRSPARDRAIPSRAPGRRAGPRARPPIRPVAAPVASAASEPRRLSSTAVSGTRPQVVAPRRSPSWTTASPNAQRAGVAPSGESSTSANAAIVVRHVSRSEAHDSPRWRSS